MISDSGWIKLHRSITEWRWFNKPNHLKLYLYLLTKCNWKSRDFEKITIKPGQMVFSLRSLSEQVHIPVSTLTRTLKDLKVTQDIRVESMGNFSLISIAKWDEYQANDSMGETEVEQKWNRSGTKVEQKWNKSEQQYKKVIPLALKHGRIGDERSSASVESLHATEVKNLWNEITFNKLPKALKVSEKRRKSINASSKELLKTVDDWHKYFEKIITSKFLCGQSGRGWKADFEWAINKNNVLKVLEGKYDNQVSIERNYAQENADKIKAMENPFLKEEK